MIKVLQVVPSLSCCGGVENYLMNYYRNINHEKFVFDFVYHIDSEPNFKSEIDSIGGRYYKLPQFSLSNLSLLKKEITKLIREEKYDIIHCHMANAAFLYFKIAKKEGIKVRILHSHQTSAADKLSHKLRNYPLLFLGKKRTSIYVACSELAGKFLFKKKKFTVINNAIDVEKYKFNEDQRINIRNKYGISEDSFVIGNIGRFCNQKNQLYLLKLLIECKEKIPNIKLLLVGDGELYDTIVTFIKNNNLVENVILTGSISNTASIYSAIDLFVLPSLYEGLPVVGVEAQCNGLHILTSTTVTTELNFSGNVEYIELNDDKKWINAICKCLDNNTRNSVKSELFDIRVQSIKLMNYYTKLV